MATSMNSSTATVKDGDIQQVREILASYECRGFKVPLVEQAGKWSITVTDNHPDDWEPDWWSGDDDDEMFVYPEAVKHNHVPQREAYPDEKTWNDAVDEAFQTKGQDGFRALLHELSQHLETDLLIVQLYVTEMPGQVIAEGMVVHPGSTIVQTAATSL